MSSDPFFAESLARGVCYVMSENLLSVLPQLDDYTCPVCASITFKPGIFPSYNLVSDNSTFGVWTRLLYPMSSSPSKTTKIPLSNLSPRRRNES